MKHGVSSKAEQGMKEGAGITTARGLDTRNGLACFLPHPCAVPESLGAHKLQCRARLSLLAPPVGAAKSESENTLGRCLCGTGENICRKILSWEGDTKEATP